MEEPDRDLTGVVQKALVSLEGQNKTAILKFARKMLQWDPNKRFSACELLEDSWLNPKP